jgi:hypothetical protein
LTLDAKGRTDLGSVRQPKTSTAPGSTVIRPVKANSASGP